jgi:hypothetical protein
MSQSGYTPIYLYNSGTTTNVPLAANLGAGELAINYADGKLFYKDNGGVVQVIGWKVTPPTAGGTGVANGSNNTISFTGNYTLGLTLSANTAVALPTSGTVISSTTALSGAVTGTPSSTTYLRGDATWATVTGGVSTGKAIAMAMIFGF